MSSNEKDIKEDFSGFTEITIHDKRPKTNNNEEPVKMDVSDAMEEKPMLPGVSEQPNPQLLLLQQQQQQPQQQPNPQLLLQQQLPQQQPSFWQSLLNRGLTLLLVGALIAVVWWWWSSSSKSASALATDNVVNAVQENIIDPVKRVLQLPPRL